MHAYDLCTDSSSISEKHLIPLSSCAPIRFSSSRIRISFSTHSCQPSRIWQDSPEFLPFTPVPPETLSTRTASYPTFCCVWKKFLPHIIISRPMTDLCWRCQQNSTAIIRSVNVSEGEKSEVKLQVVSSMQSLRLHLMRPQMQHTEQPYTNYYTKKYIFVLIFLGPRGGASYFEVGQPYSFVRVESFSPADRFIRPRRVV